MDRHSFAVPDGPRPRFPGPLATEGVVFSPFRWPRRGPAPRRSGTRVDAGAPHTQGRPTHTSLRDLLVPDPPPFRSSGSPTPGCRPMLASSLESASLAADALAPACSRESSPRAPRRVPRRLRSITGLLDTGSPVAELHRSTDTASPDQGVAQDALARQEGIGSIAPGSNPVRRASRRSELSRCSVSPSAPRDFAFSRAIPPAPPFVSTRKRPNVGSLNLAKVIITFARSTPAPTGRCTRSDGAPQSRTLQLKLKCNSRQCNSSRNATRGKRSARALTSRVEHDSMRSANRIINVQHRDVDLQRSLSATHLTSAHREMHDDDATPIPLTIGQVFLK